MRRGPPKLPRVPEVKPFARDGESDQECKCRLIREKYNDVVGTTEQEAEMVDFFTQILAAEGRGVISSFVISIMTPRYWGASHLPTDAALTTIAKTMKELKIWMHPDHFDVFVSSSRDQHELIHKGYIVLSQVVANMNTQLMGGYTAGGVSANTSLPAEQKEYILRPASLFYVTIWDMAHQKASQSAPVVKKSKNVLPTTPLMDCVSSKRRTIHACSTL